MSVAKQVTQFKGLGFSGRDVRHIGVYVMPSVEIENGASVQSMKVYIGEGTGDFSVNFPTDFIFASMSPEWVFDEFEVAGKTWPGLAIFPDDGDFAVSFGDADRKSVVLQDACQAFCTHRYQIVMKNTATGERVATDPSVKNGDRQDPV